MIKYKTKFLTLPYLNYKKKIKIYQFNDNLQIF